MGDVKSSSFIATALAQDDAEAALGEGSPTSYVPKLPRLLAFMDDAKADALAHMTFPAQHRAKLHSTNPIECVNGEVKRRTDVMGMTRPA